MINQSAFCWAGTVRFDGCAAKRLPRWPQAGRHGCVHACPPQAGRLTAVLRNVGQAVTPLRFLTSPITPSSTLCRSPTTPRSASAKIGASASCSPRRLPWTSAFRLGAEWHRKCRRRCRAAVRRSCRSGRSGTRTDTSRRRRHARHLPRHQAGPPTPRSQQSRHRCRARRRRRPPPRSVPDGHWTFGSLFHDACGLRGVGDGHVDLLNGRLGGRGLWSHGVWLDRDHRDAMRHRSSDRPVPGEDRLFGRAVGGNVDRIGDQAGLELDRSRPAIPSLGVELIRIAAVSTLAAICASASAFGATR